MNEEEPYPVATTPAVGMPPRECWRYAGSSRMGTSHQTTGTSCQDGHCVDVISDRDGQDVLVAVASDGAGSASHSHIGSEVLCTTLMEHFRILIENGANLADFQRPDLDEVLTAAVQAIENRATQEGLATRDLAATCLAAIVSPTVVVAIQVGDGAIVIDNGTDHYEPVIWPMRGEFANETVFLYQPSAIPQAEFRVIARTIRDIAVFTDGIQMVALHYESRTAPASFFRPLFNTMALQPPGSSKVLDGAVGVLLDAPSILCRTDDDRTLVLGCRR